MIQKRFEDFQKLVFDIIEGSATYLTTKNVLINIHDIEYVEELKEIEVSEIFNLEECGITINKLVLLGLCFDEKIIVVGNYVDICRKVKEVSRELFNRATN